MKKIRTCFFDNYSICGYKHKILHTSSEICSILRNCPIGYNSPRKSFFSCFLLQICDDAIDPGKDLGLFLGLERAADDGEAALDEQNLVDDVRAGLGKRCLEVVGDRLVTVDHQSHVLCACLGQLAAEEAQGIRKMSLSRDRQDHDALLVAGVGGRDNVYRIKREIILCLDLVCDVVDLLLARCIKNSHFDSHFRFLQSLNNLPTLLYHTFSKMGRGFWNILVRFFS